MSNFYTDIIQKSPRFESSLRCADPALLHPVMRRKALAILRDAASHGIKLAIYETYRSQTRQEALFEDGATQLRHVGVHHYGLACDIVYLRAGEPSWTGNFELLGHLARAHGLIWGGDWGHPSRPTSFPDNDHVQWCSMADQGPLLRGAWYPDDDYDPYE